MGIDRLAEMENWVRGFTIGGVAVECYSGGCTRFTVGSCGRDDMDSERGNHGGRTCGGKGYEAGEVAKVRGGEGIREAGSAREGTAIGHGDKCRGGGRGCDEAAVEFGGG